MSLSNCTAAHAFPSAQPAPAYDRPGRRTSFRPYIAPGEPNPRPARVPLTAISGAQTPVLIADAAISAGPLVHLLQGLGYSLTRAAFCGASALELARDFRPSIALIALDLPDMSARYIAQRLLGRARAGQLRLIAIADDHSLASTDRFHNSGFLSFLTKPIALTALQQVLRAKLS